MAPSVHFNSVFVVVQRDQPKMVMEYWTGWFDNWGGPHYVFDADGEQDMVLWGGILPLQTVTEK